MAYKTRLKGVFDIPKGDYEHHKMRVQNIIKKAKGDDEKEKSLARSMANKIITPDKAYGRFLVSDELNNPHLGKIFLHRFKELTYTIHDLRRETIDAFLEELEREDRENELNQNKED